MEKQNSTVELSGKRRELLEALLQQRERVIKTGITRRQQDGPVPLSFAQERLWFFDQYYPQSTLYNIPAPIPFPGALNHGAMRAALNEIVRRHESLRTVFRTRNGQPVQVILPQIDFDLPLVNLQSYPEAERNQAFAALLSTESNHVFNLAKGPLLRAVLIRVQEEFHYLLLVIHHIVSDAWSMNVFMRELQQLYWAFSQGQGSPLPALPIQYPDFAVWQRNWLQGEVLRSQLEYWKQQLAGTESVMLEMPTEQQRPATLSFRGASISFWLSVSLSARIRALIQETQSTPFMVLLAGFAALLFRYTGQTSLIVGFPTANRNRSELEGLIGFFVNSLPLHIRCSDGISFRQLVTQVREITLGALAHQDLPFEKLVQELQPARNLNTNPLFQVMFDFHNSMTPGDQQSMSEEEDAQESQLQSALSTGTSKFDLTLSMLNAGNKIGGALEFSTDLFDEAKMRRFLSHYQNMLQEMAAHPEQRISVAGVMSPAERQQILVDWNNTAAPFPATQYVPGIFESQVERTPYALAVLFQDQSLTYAQLNAQANQLAWLLRSKGVGRESAVAICMERSPELVVSVLGVLKAGGCYVPIDPDDPHDRIAFVLQDAGVKILLTQEDHRTQVTYPVETVLAVDNLGTELHEFPGSNLSALALPENACSVIYTSGSSGRPQGIVIEHKSVANSAGTLAKLFSIGEGTRVLQFSAFSLDVAGLEIFETLFSGGTLYLGRRNDLASGEPLIQLLKTKAINMVTLPPSVWANLPEADLPNLKVGVAGGEALPAAVMNRWASSRQFFNAYGPIETATASSVAQCLSGARPTIGRPLSNCQYYVVDRNFQPCVIGVIGELLIGGVGLARGYLGRPDLTAEKFVPNPFSTEPGSRLYRTGDLVRFLPNGEVDYLGRTDSQIRIQGFRIELGEIEVVLSELSSIAAAVVAIFVEPSGQQQLVAYIVPQDPADPPSTENVRAHLLAKLPLYMAPQYFILLEEIPRTPAGTVDMRALPSPGEAARRQTYAPPSNPLEHVVAGIWSEILGISHLGIHDNFFELGGHSLLVMQIVSRVRDSLGAEMPVRAIFEAPTIAGLADFLLQDPSTADHILGAAALLVDIAELDKQEQSDAGSGPVADDVAALTGSNGFLLDSETEVLPNSGPVEPVIPKAPAPVSFGQERLWFLDHFQPGNTSYNVFASFAFAEPVNVPALSQAVQQMVQRHEVLRTIFGMEQGQPVQIVQPTMPIQLQATDLRHLPVNDARMQAGAVIAGHCQSPFDLSQGPLLRTFLFQIGPQENLFAMVFHHIIADTWSMNIFFSELVTIYRALSRGSQPNLPPLKTQYSDFARWQRQWLTGKVLEENVSYWRKQLADAPPVLELPLDYPRPLNAEFHRGGAEFIRIPEQTLAALEQISRAENATLFMTLLAALKILLYRYTGQKHIVVGTPIANRNRMEFEPLVGFFVNTLVVHTDMSGDPSFRQLLARVKESTLGAYGHQEFPFERLVAELNPERNLNVSPLFQVMFVEQKGPIMFPAEGPEVNDIESVASRQGIAKFDITFYLEETGRELKGFIEYAANLFHPESIRRMIRHFGVLVERMAHASTQPISTIAMLTENEQKALLQETEMPPVPQGISAVHHFLEAQAEKNPKALAISGATKITYSELNARANQLARLLQQLGVNTEVCVGVHLERGPDLFVTLLGVLKAGGAYLPLDPQFPAARIGFMIDKARVPLVVTTRHLFPGLEGCSARIEDIEELNQLLAGQSSENLPWNGCESNLCYVVYTSGSTGTPKCVGLTHATLINLVSWELQATTLRAPATTVQYASPSFDVCLQEVSLAWASGSSLLCISEEQHRDPAELCRAMVEGNAKRLYLPFVALQQLAEHASTGDEGLPPLQEVIASGEQLRITPRIVDFFNKLGDCTLMNQYGPSESHVVTAYNLGIDRSAWQGLPPIGSAVAGARLYVLDEVGDLAAFGVPGELFLGGGSLARGYLNDPEGTAQRFLPDPFSGIPGSRMYRTGDIVRYDVNGSLQFMHRKDEQVKIRGFRVELGEIEHHLSRYPGVAQVAVTTWSLEGSYNARLAAYVVPQPQAELNPRSLADFLKQQLPEYMIPSDFVFLDSLPLTATGKLARSRLPRVERARSQTDKAYVAPRTPMERQLAAFWAELLGLVSPGVEDNFFELGGHSLLVTQFVTRIAEEFQLKVPVRQVFETPTIAQLSIFIMEAQAQLGSSATLEQLLQEVEEMSDDEAANLLVTEEDRSSLR